MATAKVMHSAAEFGMRHDFQEARIPPDGNNDDTNPMCGQ